MASPKNAVFMCVDPTLGVPAPATATATARQFPLGYTARFEDKQTGTAYRGCAEFVYCQGSNVTALGQVVHISNNSAVLLAAANSASFFPVGVAAGALSATNVYGWVQVAGLCDYLVLTNASLAAGGANYINAGTAGFLQSGAVAGNKVVGIVAPQSNTSADTYALVQLNRPQVVGLSANL